MAGRAVVCQVLVVSDMTFIIVNINHYDYNFDHSRLLIYNIDILIDDDYFHYDRILIRLFIDILDFWFHPLWDDPLDQDLRELKPPATSELPQHSMILHVLQDSFGTSSLSILSDFKYQSLIQ